MTYSAEVPKLQDLLERKARQLAKREAAQIHLSIPDIPGTLVYTDSSSKNTIPWCVVRQRIIGVMADVLYEKHLETVTEEFMRAIEAVKDLEKGTEDIEF
jgi:hypothetical protein